ncbi:MAG TPA: thioredoxin domain-containing protein [Terriglobales bacterium]|nr:thioredoxin domain-containing protein [Terriglobales bacterium]
MKLVNTFIFILVLCVVAAGAGQSTRKKQASAKNAAHTSTSTAAPSPVLLPSKTEIEAALQRSFGYDSALSWTILDVKPAEIPGLVDVLVSVNRQQPFHMYMAPEMKHVIIGQMQPFGANPFEPAREKLKAADGPSRGASKPVIEIVEFSDLECPHCKVAVPVLEKLLTDFPQVRLTFQQFPLPASLHPWAMKGAEYADCAGHQDPQAFWKFVDSVFENQGSIALATADDKLKEFANAAGLDGEKLAACAATPETESRVEKSIALGQSLNVNSTPTVFINGREIPGISPNAYDQLKQVVQFEIEHAGK